MKNFYSIFLSTILVLLLSGCAVSSPQLKEVAPQARLTVNTFGATSMSESQVLCYAVGNVGFDAVINASNGISIETMLELIDPDNPIAYMLDNTIKFAYVWEHSPHELGMYAYARCLHYLNILDSIEA